MRQINCLIIKLVCNSFELVLSSLEVYKYLHSPTSLELIPFISCINNFHLLKIKKNRKPLDQVELNSTDHSYHLLLVL